MQLLNILFLIILYARKSGKSFCSFLRIIFYFYCQHCVCFMRALSLRWVECLPSLAASFQYFLKTFYFINASIIGKSFRKHPHISLFSLLWFAHSTRLCKKSLSVSSLIIPLYKRRVFPCVHSIHLHFCLQSPLNSHLKKKIYTIVQHCYYRCIIAFLLILFFFIHLSSYLFSLYADWF